MVNVTDHLAGQAGVMGATSQDDLRMVLPALSSNFDLVATG
jgi:hypothetical protein